MRLQMMSFTLVAVIAGVAALTVCGAAKVSLEEIHIDDSTITMECDPYGQPEVYFSKDNHLLVEIDNYGLFPEMATGVFYLRNSGTEGQVEITAEKGDNKLVKEFVFRAAQDYMVKVDVGIGQAGSWKFTSQRGAHSVTISVGDIRSSVSFNLPICKETKLRDIRIQEISDEIVAVSDGAPDASWFEDSIWQEKYKYCDNVQKYIKLRNDGIVEYSHSSPEKLKSDGNDTWKVEGPLLVISWNDGFAILRIPLDGKCAERYFGTHSRVSIPIMIEKVEQPKVEKAAATP